jgi:pimeloyl-ACP methyl ester carboxylesterase
MKRLNSTPPFRSANGEVVLGSIAEVAYLELGGIDQWVMIRGASLANPPLIMLHGGPGLSETAFFRRHNAELEESFTVVYWDQRGAGKSFHSSIPRVSMTVEQLVSDLDALVDAVRKRLGHDKVVLFGHSWGSLLGVLYVARFPEKVAAYIGSGQIGDWVAAESATYAYAVGEAKRRGKTKILAKLAEIGAPPYPAASVFIERTCIARLDGMLGPKAMWEMAKMIVGAKESSVFELPAAWRAFRWTMDAMWNEVSRLDLNQLAPVLQVPVFFFLGRKDHWVLPENSVAYYDRLTAPSKQLVWFERSGHEPFVDEAAKFNQLLVELVRPVATRRGSPPVVSRRADARSTSRGWWRRGSARGGIS